MPHVLTLQVPAGAPFRALAAEAAGRVLACVGGGPKDVEQLTAAVADAAGELSGAGGDLQLSFESTADGINVQVTCGDASRTVHQAATRQAS